MQIPSAKTILDFVDVCFRSIKELPIFDFLDVRCRSVKQYQNPFRFRRCPTPFSKIVSIMKFLKFWEKMHVFCNGFDFLLNMNIQ